MAQRANYTGRITRVLTLIERAAQTGDWPDLAALASAAALSEFHFHRIYRLMAGETPQQTLARARLGGSLPVLAGPEGIAGATATGAYATSQAYARALKALTGATPSQLRNNPDQFAAVAEAIARPTAPDGTAPLAISIVTLEPLRLMAVERSGPLDSLNAGYGLLFDMLLQQISPEEVTGLYGIPRHDPRSTPPEEFGFACAVSTAVPVAEAGDLQAIDLPGGTSLCLKLSGDYDNAHAAIDQLYQIAVALDLVLAGDLPLFAYHHDPDEVPESELLADLHLLLA
jgi:AraC family transcriptional regulator